MDPCFPQFSKKSIRNSWYTVVLDTQRPVNVFIVDFNLVIFSFLTKYFVSFMVYRIHIMYAYSPWIALFGYLNQHFSGIILGSVQGLVICLICLCEVADMLVIIRCYSPGSAVSLLHQDGYIIVLPMVPCVKFITDC